MGTGERVMIVDDSQEQLDISSSILQALGYETVTASSGEDALSYLAEDEVDLVVLDMVMNPGMDGLDTYRRVLEISPGQKALIVTGYAETERVSEALSLGAAQCISKPYSLSTLATAVREELDREP
jgi:DNA-binding NtrC family response regulator